MNPSRTTAPAVVPPAGTPLAHSDVGLQAFTHGRHLGVQFHPEITPEVFASWRSGWSPRTAALVAAEIDLDGLVAELDDRAPACAAACRDLVGRFCARAFPFAAERSSEVA